MLSNFLQQVFPELAGETEGTDCWVTRAMISENSGLKILSRALEKVAEDGSLETLKNKVRREHPVEASHQQQYDARVRDCLNEACAFAWCSTQKTGRAVLVDEPGQPDLFIDTGHWVEAKSIHSSVSNDIVMKDMIAGSIISGSVQSPHPTLFKKFDDALLDARKKFARVGSTASIVFFNLAAVDIGQWPKVESIKDTLMAWATDQERNYNGLGIVICFSCKSQDCI